MRRATRLSTKWMLLGPTGSVGGVCTDAQDHVFIVNRRNLTDNDLDAAYQAPTVIEFDPQGNVANSWGDSNVLGSGRHACYVDYENNIWIPSNQDGIVQKFTHDGSKLLLQIGTKGVIDSSDGTLAGIALNSSHTGFYRPGSVQHACYHISQKKRKRIEECFGWLKTIALLRKVRHRGTLKVDWMFTFACAAYNLVRMRNLMAATVPAQ